MLKKLTLALFAATTICASSSAQKVDLDKYTFDVEYLTLPRHYVGTELRSYDVTVGMTPMANAAISPEEAESRVSVARFKRDMQNPTVTVDVQLGDITFYKTETKSRTDVSKDKNGKVTKSTTYYSIVATYNVAGSYTIAGPANPYMSEDEASKQARRKGEPQANPFLTGNTATDNKAKHKETVNVGTQVYYTTPEFNSFGDANQNYRANGEEIRRKLYDDFLKGTLNAANTRANLLYGYHPIKENYYLWILNSKSHPENEMQQNAIKAIKVIMAKTQATQSTAGTLQELAPVMQYFESVKTKYTGDDKREKKLRYGAYFNLAKLYLVLDQPDKAIEQANGLIKNDFDTSDGEEIIDKAEALKRELAFNHMDARHDQ